MKTVLPILAFLISVSPPSRYLPSCLAQEKSPDRDFTGPAAKCGSEIPWLTDLDDAAKQSKATGKPIFWWVDGVEGSPMDRKTVIQKYMLAGPWMMPDVVSIVSRRFIPLRLRSDGSLHDVKPLSFIEPGFLVMDHKLAPILKMDRWSVYNEGLIRRWLLDALKKAGAKSSSATAEDLFLDGDYESALKACKDEALRAKILRRLGQTAELTGEEEALALLSGGEIEKAAGALKDLPSDQARYLYGATLHLLNRDDEGKRVWKKLVDEKADSRWSWKASAELSGNGPFVRGFEVFELYDKKDTSHAVRYLLRMQRADGSWNDSNYNFGGDNSLPNVYMACTALNALALREWSEIAPEAVKKSLERAEAYMADESKIAADDRNEIIWAYGYRLLYYAAAKDKKRMAAMIAAIEKQQHKSGVWRHEYENPFVTASVLEILAEAKQAGAEVSDAMVKRGIEALKTCRDGKGIFSYGYPGNGDKPQGGAGRTPLCELALYLWGASTAENVKTAIAKSFEHHALLERVRKYDDHSDSYHNGGFFFWYDVQARAEAIARVKDTKSAEKLRDMVWSIQEPDGTWIDSHELGHPYGTAMALLTLRRCGAGPTPIKK